MSEAAWNVFNPVVGLKPLFDTAAELDSPEDNQKSIDVVRTLIEPMFTESLRTIEYQLNPTQPMPEYRLDYGRIFCLTSYCLVIALNDAEELTCSLQTSETGSDISLSGWVTGLMLGYDIEPPVRAIEAPHNVASGIWMALSAEIPTSHDEYFEGAYVQLPQCRFLNPASLAN